MFAFGTALLGAPAGTQADVMVSNFGKDTSSPVALGSNEMAQGFRTGFNAGGFALESIELDFPSVPSSSDASGLTVTLWSSTIEDRPDSLLATLTNPSNLSDSNSTNVKAFYAPAGTGRLKRRTWYFVHLSYTGDTEVTLGTARSVYEDAAFHFTGWTINNIRLYRPVGTTGSWTPSSLGLSPGLLRIRINGRNNTAPTAADSMVTTNEDTPHVFTAADFNFADADARDSLAGVKIVTLPAEGTLALDSTPVTTDQVIPRADIDGGRLRFTPAANAYGDAHASFTFKVNDGTVNGATAYTMTVNVTPMNDPATGSPAITVPGGGPPTVGATLAATSTIDDADGVGDFSYQWIRVDGATENNISEATSASYQVTAADVGKKLKVRVRFTDGAGNPESRTSGPTAVVAAPTTPTVTLALTPASIPENGGTSTVTATLDRPSSETTTIEISAAPVTPAAAADFSLTSNRRLTFAAGATVSTGTVRITARNNGIYTPNKAVTVSGTATNGMGIDQPEPLTLTIVEDDTESTAVTLSVSPNTVSEGATGNAQRVTVTATLDEAARPEATAVSVTVAGDTATAGVDFTAVQDFTMTIPADATSAMETFTLAPLNDNADEPDETVRISGTTTAGLSVLPAAGVSVAISDNDPIPQVSLVLTPASISEDGGTSTVTATLDRPSSADTTITVSAAAGTNADTDDFSLTGTTLTIAAGTTESTGTVTVTAIDNAIDHPDREVEVSGVATNTQGIAQPSEQSLNIADDEDTSVTRSTGITMTVSPDRVAEDATGSARNVTVAATLNGAARDADTEIIVSVENGTAFAGTDFAEVADFTITIAAEAVSGTHTFTLAPVDDEKDAPDRTILLRGKTTAPGLSVEPLVGLSVTIEDDDPEPVVTLALTPAEIPEDNGESTVTATLDRPSSADTTITVSAAAGTNADTDDFSLTGTTLMIAAGTTESTGTVTVTAIDNAIDHPDREVEVSGVATNTQGIAQPSEQSLNIADDEDTSATRSTGITMTVSPDRVAEDATGSARNVTVAATLNGAARDADTEVIVSVENGTAFAGTDFAEVADFTITIAAEAVSGTHTFTLAPVDDEKDAPDRTILLRGKTTAPGLSVEPLVGLSVTIEDDDPEPVVTLALTPAEIPEDNGESTVTATLDRPSSETTTIEISTAPVTPAAAADFSLTSNRRLTFAAGATVSTGTVRITARNNGIYTPNKAVTVSGTATNGMGIDQPEPLTLTIVEDDTESTAVTLSVSPNTVSEGATGNAQRVTVTATLDEAARPEATAVSVTVAGDTATAGVDFTAVQDFTMTIPADATSAMETFTLAPLNDNADEPDETVRISGTTAAGLSVLPAAGVNVAISDNDPVPQVSLVLTPASISEDGGTSTVTATLDRPSSADTTITVSAAAGTNADTDDFSLTGTTLTIAAGTTESTGTVTVTAIDNAIDHPDREVEVSGVATNTQGIAQPSEQTLNIADDEDTSATRSTGITMTVSPDRVAEDATGSARNVTVAATLNGAARDADTEVIVSVENGTAFAGTDFAEVADFTITIAAEAVSGTHTFTLAPVDDEKDAPDRTILLRGKTTAPGLSVEPLVGLSVTIEDDDPEPVVTLALTPAEIPEDDGESTVTATLDRPSSETTTIEISAAPVTPAAAADFSLTSNRRLTFAAGATVSTGTVRITARNNGIYTPNKAVTVSGTATNGMGIDQPEPLTLTIVEDDTESTAVTLSVSPNTVSEGATGNAQRVTVTATLDEAARPEATAVSVTVAGDTATAGVDFTAVQDFTMTIPADATSAMETFTLAPLNDNADEPDETVRISGTTAAGLSVLPAAGVSVAISDNDPVPQVSLALTPASIPENGGTSTVTATLDRPSSADTTITVSAAAGTNADTDDFSLTGTTLMIAAGTTESTGTVTVTAIDNAIDHPDREVEVSGVATNTQGIAQPSEQTLNIADDEDTSATPSTGITMTVSPDRVAEDATGSARNVTVAATLNGAARDADTEIIVSVENGTAFAGTDFAEVADFTITIAAEAVSGTHTFTLAPVDDEKDAPDRTILLRGKTTAPGLSVEPLVGLSVTIEDDDPEPVVTLALTPVEIPEDDGESTVTATLDRPSSAAIRVNVTAAPVTPAVAGDFRLSGNGRLTIAAGQTTSTGTVTLAAVDNDIAADDRMVEVSGTATTNDTRVGVVQPEALRLTITDDDQPSTMVTLTVSPDRVAENGGARRLTVTGMLDGAPESADTVVTLTVTEGAAEAVEATLTIPTGQRSATAALTLTPVDNAIDDDDATVRVNASTTSSLTLNPSSLEVTVTDDDERGVRVTPVALTVIEGPEGGASYTVVLGSQPTSTVTVTPSVSSEPPGANLSVSPSNLSFTTSNWNEPQTVTVTAQDDQDVEEDAAVEVMHTVSGGDYVSVTAASVTVTVPGFEIMADGSVHLRVPISGEPVVTVPEGTSIPAGTRVTVPSSLAGGTVRFAMVADDHEALTDPPRGFRTGDAVLDIEPNPPLPAGQTATVCLPASSGSQRVHRYDEDETPPEWVALDPPPSGSPRGLACGVTDRFMLFALGSAPNETVAKAWLARFGRTAAQHVLDGIRERLSAAREAGFRGKLGGHEIGTYRAGIQGDRTEDGSGWNGPGQNGLGRNDDELSPWRLGTRDRGDTAADPFHDGGPGLRGWWRPVAERELITGTAFTATGEAGGDSYTVWGRGAHTRFDGRDGNGALDGAVTTATFGGDWSFDRWIAGLSMSHSRGSGGYRPDDREDRLEASVTGLYPYVGYKLTDRVSVWGATGYGKGELSLTPDGGEAIDTDLSLWMAAAGARSELLKRTGPDGPALALEADGLLVRTSTPAMSRAAVAADTSRLRLKLAGSWATMLEDQARLTPSLEIGFRHDGGEAEDGFGLDLGGGLAYAVPAHGFTVEINGRWLLAHRDSAFRDWGVSGSLRYDPRPSSERGLNLSVTSSVGGSAKGGANALFGQGLPAGPAANDNSVPGLGLTTELGYGFSALGGTAVQIPWAAWSLTESDGQTVRLGWRLRLGPGGSSADFGIEAGRSEPQGAVPDYRIGIALRLPLGGGPAFLGGSGEALPD